MIFELGDWVWVHFGKERFHGLQKSKLNPRGDGSFQVLERINDNAYKIDLPGDYGVSATFNVSNLSPFGFEEVDDSRTNLYEEWGNDENQASIKHDDLLKFNGPTTKAKTKKFKDTLQVFMKSIWCEISETKIQNEKSIILFI